jgi:hypothetical protein
MEWTTFLAFAALGKIFGHKSSGFVIPARGSVTFRLIQNDRMRFWAASRAAGAIDEPIAPCPPGLFRLLSSNDFFARLAKTEKRPALARRP